MNLARSDGIPLMAYGRLRLDHHKGYTQVTSLPAEINASGPQRRRICPDGHGLDLDDLRLSSGGAGRDAFIPAAEPPLTPTPQILGRERRSGVLPPKSAGCERRKQQVFWTHGLWAALRPNTCGWMGPEPAGSLCRQPPAGLLAENPRAWGTQTRRFSRRETSGETVDREPADCGLADPQVLAAGSPQRAS